LSRVDSRHRIEKIGLEVEMPLVHTNGHAASFDDVENLFQSLVKQGWEKKIDANTGALVGVSRETCRGIEIISTDFGVCTLESALAPVISLDEAIDYWRDFKFSILLPNISKSHLKVLGYGTQPISSQLKDLIAKKGHYVIWKNMIREDAKEWIFQNVPGICSVQFNFQIPKEKSLEIINTFLHLSAFIWAASANDSIVAGKKLPYKSQRFRAYTELNNGGMCGRQGSTTKPYKSLCDYINRTWNIPIFEIFRDGSILYPADQCLTTNRFIDDNEAYFYTLDEDLSLRKIELDDLKLAIYLSWPDFRLKFSFSPEITLNELVRVVREEDDKGLHELIDYIVFEIRPIAMQANEEELSWLVFSYLVIENLELINQYTSSWHYEDVRTAAIASQISGLKQNFNGKTLGEIGLELLERLSQTSSQTYGKYLDILYFRCINHCSPGDDAIKIFDNQGMEVLLDHLIINSFSE